MGLLSMIAELGVNINPFVTGLGRAVISYGGRLGYTDAGETPNTQVCIYDFGGKTIVTETRGLKTEPFNPNLKGGGWIFFGTQGKVETGRTEEAGLKKVTIEEK